MANKKGGFLIDLISRLIDDASKPSPKDTAPSRVREGDRRPFKEVHASHMELFRQVDQEKAMLAKYDREGISALISGPSGGTSRKALPSPTPIPSPGFLGRIMGKKSGTSSKRGELPDYVQMFEPFLQAKARINKDFNLIKARGVLAGLTRDMENNKGAIPLDPNRVLETAYAAATPTPAARVAGAKSPGVITNQNLPDKGFYGLYKKYAPPTENDTVKYANNVAKELGIDPIRVTRKELESKIPQWAQIKARLEGFHNADPNSAARRNNNPGNLEFHGQPGAKADPKNPRWAKFKTLDQGWQALHRQLRLDLNRFFPSD